jgi:hypothetical protein
MVIVEWVYTSAVVSGFKNGRKDMNNITDFEIKKNNIKRQLYN